MHSARTQIGLVYRASIKNEFIRVEKQVECPCEWHHLRGDISLTARWVQAPAAAFDARRGWPQMQSQQSCIALNLKRALWIVWNKCSYSCRNTSSSLEDCSQFQFPCLNVTVTFSLVQEHRPLFFVERIIFLWQEVMFLSTCALPRSLLFVAFIYVRLD